MRRGLTKTELAADLDVTPSTLSRWEEEGPPPKRTDSLLDRLSSSLNFPADYFVASELEVPALDSTLFRAGSRATQKQKSAAVASGANARPLVEWLRHNYNFPLPHVPDLSGLSPADAASHVRTIWQLGDRPFPNSIHLAESVGVAVMGLPPAASAVDAFSMWEGEQPYIFLARRRTPEGTRFDLAHELGHLLLHSRANSSDATSREPEADEFASNLLIPPNIVHAHLRVHPSLDDIFQLKRILKVSAMAMLRATYENGKLSEREYKNYLTALSIRGFRKEEPGSQLQYERSRVFDYVLSSEGGASISGIAAVTKLPEQDLHALMLGSQPHAVGGSTTSAITAPARPALRVVR
ncbi:XRE family transcriptional regulator [Corynebacterium jeddahense]|uniref:HTH cro/C1-type domain-containing protein n=2 Tax=Corynebacterium jeddahense TaxID=1414719 RepID=A0ABY7UNV0_9CORY|nr:XRE family transcriptional regulator [Corynebacterium jeddahense]WCZ39344.1 hypothetical protein CJEDD_08775 [Corynebacterium jeddahense]